MKNKIKYDDLDFDTIDKNIKDSGKIKLSTLTANQIESANKLVSKYGMYKIDFGGAVKAFDSIGNPIELVQFLSSRKKIYDLSEVYVSHYTNFETLKNILGTKTFYLSNPSTMNDGLEFIDSIMNPSKLFFASFSIENRENMGMWSMYGQPWENGVKISIPKNLFLKWTKANNILYEVDDKAKGSKLENVLDEDSYKVSISRVAYVEYDSNRKISFIECGTTRNRTLNNIRTQILTGYVKDFAWSYEKEIRLRVDVKEKLDKQKIAIRIPDEILKNLQVTLGPRFVDINRKKEISRLVSINNSIFTGKLNSVYCDRCTRKKEL